MARFEGGQEVASVVCEVPATSRVFERHGIDYCCGGRQPIADACRERGVDPATVLRELEAEAARPDAVPTDWREERVSALLDHILDRHHAYLRRELPRVRDLLAKVEKAHGANHPELFPELSRHYGRLHADLDMHLMKEEEVLFPAIRAMESGGGGGFHCGHVSAPIQVMEYEHDEAGRILARLRELTGGYVPPPDACPTFRACYEGLAALEADLHMHIHLENNVLHPRALAMAGDCHH
jgi:regulator of cell morphogenesis and NO signaling